MAFGETLLKAVNNGAKEADFNANSLFEFAKLYNSYHVESFLKLNFVQKNETKVEVLNAFRNKTITETDKIFLDDSKRDELARLEKKVFNASYYTKRDTKELVKKGLGKKKPEEQVSMPETTGLGNASDTETSKSKKEPTNNEIMSLMKQLNEATNKNIDAIKSTGILNTESIAGLKESLDGAKGEYKKALDIMNKANANFELTRKLAVENKNKIVGVEERVEKTEKTLNKLEKKTAVELQHQIDELKKQIGVLTIEKIEEVIEKAQDIEEKMNDFESKIEGLEQGISEKTAEFMVDQKIEALMENL